ncbi:MAG: chitinase [Clostridia bacterium]|nr:chitinase [Clostridia bacterium]
MKKYILGYAMNHSLPTVTKEDVLRLTHLNLAFGLIKDGLLDMSQLTHIDLLPTFREWNPDLKIVLSVGGWGAGGFSTMAMTEEGRKAFAASCLEAVEKYGLDGIDIDWEYPCDNSAGIDSDPRDKENYTLLFKALREAIGPDKTLSNAVGAGQYFIDGSEMDKVAAILDYVQLMTYDMRSGFTKQAGHHAALGLSAGDTTNTSTRGIVEMYHDAGVPYEKMIVGAAFYCRHFTGVRNENNGLLQPSESVGEYGPNFDGITDEFKAENSFTEYWDDDAEASYLWNGSTLVSFESPEAIRRKCRYVKEKGLLGIMYWEHGSDTTKELLSTMFETINE